MIEGDDDWFVWCDDLGYLDGRTIAPTPKATLDPEISTLTDGQEIGLSLLGVASATFSLLGSSVIVYKVLARMKQKRATPYDRIMLGLSGCDIVASVGFGLAPILLPQETSQRVWAKGNDATCTFVGFLYQLGFSAVWYNGLLSFYYLLTVKFGIKRQNFSKYFEVWFHATTLVYFTTTATLGAALGFFSELELSQGCWIGEYPQGCEAEGNCKSKYIGWSFAGGPFLFSFLAVATNNLCIYCHVRSSLGNNVKKTKGRREKNHKNKDNNSNISKNSKGRAATATSQTTTTTIPSPKNNNNNNNNDNTVAARQREVHKKQIAEVAVQGFLYVGTFFTTYTPGFAIRILESIGWNPSDEASIYWLLLLDAFLKPLQGLLNMFVYTKPYYTRIRAAHPEWTRFQAIREACTSDSIPTLSEIVSSSNMSTGSSSNRLAKKLAAHKEGNNTRKSSGVALDAIQEESQEEEEEDGHENAEGDCSDEDLPMLYYEDVEEDLTTQTAENTDRSGDTGIPMAAYATSLSKDSWGGMELSRNTMSSDVESHDKNSHNGSATSWAELGLSSQEGSSLGGNLSSSDLEDDEEPSHLEDDEEQEEEPAYQEAEEPSLPYPEEEEKKDPSHSDQKEEECKLFQYLEESPKSSISRITSDGNIQAFVIQDQDP